MPEERNSATYELNNFLIWTLLLNLVVGLVLVTSIRPQFYGPEIFGIALLGGLLALGCAATWHLCRGSSIGEKFCAVFYLIQVVDVGFTDGSSIGAIWGLAINFRLNSDATAPVNLNVTAVLFLVLSLVAMGNRRIQRLEAAANNGI